MIQGVFQFGDSVELALTVHFRFNVVDFIVRRLKVALDLQYELLDGFFIRLRIIPLDHGMVEFVFHAANATVILIDHLLVFA